MPVTGLDVGNTIVNESPCSPGVYTLVERDRKCTNKQLNIMLKVVKTAKNENNFEGERERMLGILFYLRWPKKYCLKSFIFFPKLMHMINL